MGAGFVLSHLPDGSWSGEAPPAMPAVIRLQNMPPLQPAVHASDCAGLSEAHVFHLWGSRAVRHCCAGGACSDMQRCRVASAVPRPFLSLHPAAPVFIKWHAAGGGLTLGATPYFTNFHKRFPSTSRLHIL